MHMITFPRLLIVPGARHGWLASVAALCLGATAFGAVPTQPAKRAAVVGNPVSLLVQPEVITFNGPRASQQVVVTGRYADGSVRDLTGLCEFAADNSALVDLGSGGFLT